MKRNKFLQLKNKKGFTLIEMLVAVLIFSVSVSALTSMSAKSIKTSRSAEKQIVADYLALEAIEVVYNLRDTALLHQYTDLTWEMVFQGGADIVASNDGCFNGTGTCNFYPEGGQLVLGNCGDCKVYMNNTSIYYYQVHESTGNTGGGTDTGYKRTIKISSVDDGQVSVTVKVSWDGGEVTYVEMLYLWQ